jgi:glycosyltransferase involved in cell wall biosynthesis
MSAVPLNTPAKPERIRLLELVGNAIVGGMELCVERLIAWLPAERFDIYVLCPFDGVFADRLRALGVEVLITPMPDDPPWSAVQMVTQLVRTRGIDLLHAHLPNAHLLAALAGALTARPVLTTIHGRQLATLDLELHRAVGSHISVVCRQTYFHALGLGVDPARLSLEPNGVDAERFRPQPRAETGLRAALGLTMETPLVGFVGRLSPEKGPEVFVRAALQLQARCPGAQAVLIGDGPLRPQLQRQIEQLGLVGRVHLAGEWEDMPAVYAALDLLVMPSHSEAMPLALMEAMACGLAVVATRVGGVPDIVEHGASGWLVGCNDFDDIAARCAGLLADAALRRRFGERARARVLEQLSLSVSTERVARLLARLARAPAALEAQAGEHEVIVGRLGARGRA